MLAVVARSGAARRREATAPSAAVGVGAAAVGIGAAAVGVGAAAVGVGAASAGVGAAAAGACVATGGVAVAATARDDASCRCATATRAAAAITAAMIPARVRRPA